MNYIFDGSYAGLLTAVFESFERKHFSMQLFIKDTSSHFIFNDDVLEVHTSTEKAQRVLKGLQSKLSKDQAYDLYKVFLSEDIQSVNALCYIIQQIFLGKDDILQNSGDARVLLFDKTLTKVNRERHRMKAFIRFQKSSDGLYYALVDPDFNVLPLILNFFKQRYADQHWLIYDVRRNYGLYYDKKMVTEVKLTSVEKQNLSTHTTEITIDEKEVHFQNLWKQYFKSTNIVARKNMKLHLQHVPRRYWKYLVEKQV